MEVLLEALEAVKSDVSKKKALVLWSGGFDSTSLIFYYLDKGYEVDTVAGSIEGNEGQSISEKFARLQMQTMMQRDKLPVNFFTSSTFDIRKNNSSCGVCQPVLWLNLLFFNIKEFHDVAAMGYVKGDDVWHYKTEVFDVWNSMMKFRHNNEKAILEFPFEWETKEEIARSCWTKERQKYFKFLSSSEYGTHWSLDTTWGKDEKNSELRKLWNIITKDKI